MKDSSYGEVWKEVRPWKFSRSKVTCTKFQKHFSQKPLQIATKFVYDASSILLQIISREKLFDRIFYISLYWYGKINAKKKVNFRFFVLRNILPRLFDKKKSSNSSPRRRENLRKETKLELWLVMRCDIGKKWWMITFSRSPVYRQM